MKRMLIILIAILAALTASARDYVVTQFGVKNDSTKLQTAALQKIIDRASEEGGGNVVIPKGTFLTGALFFKPGTKLSLQEGAVLKGSDNIKDYPLMPSRMEGRSIYYYPALINAYHVDGFEINGPGTVNGNGRKFWRTFWERRAQARKEGRECTNLEVSRPRLVFIWGSDGVKLNGAKFINSGFWTTHFYQCDDLTIENCRMETPPRPQRCPSTDAIDLDVCRRVKIKGCYFSTDDDGVCIKGGKGTFAHKARENGSVEDVMVEDCTFGPNLHGILTMGSECIHAKNITLRNCKVETGCTILRFKMRPDTYQVYENITVENVVGKCGSIIDMKPWTQFYSLEGEGEKPFGLVRNITIRDVDVECPGLGIMEGNPDDRVENVVFENVKVAGAKSTAFRDAYQDATKMTDVTIDGKGVEYEN